ncbi:hypothetical protein RB4886 [Rhodopirellula baltica SH 1]|uniref:Uncharacterized protein n=1 Tax=Rhodopirellula baltica (strain DSM 10527 / NCIMB 13988 / SH1) TaxID=243090 RepID=Q7UH24_RHOBA|nr:hypothetical protein RB4886 [Rhodopirellula baltica SH 1]
MVRGFIQIAFWIRSNALVVPKVRPDRCESTSIVRATQIATVFALLRIQPRCLALSLVRSLRTQHPGK